MLDESDDSILAVSYYGLECRIFDSSSASWERSSLRDWLNDRFLMTAFTKSDRSYLMNDPAGDPVTLLTSSQVERFFDSRADRICEPTSHARDSGAYRNPKTGGGWWWTRSAGSSSGKLVSVNSNGRYDYETKPSGENGMVRPAVWIYVR